MSPLQEIGYWAALIVMNMALIKVLFFPDDPENPA